MTLCALTLDMSGDWKRAKHPRRLRSMEALERSVTAVSVLPLGDADHRREVGHRMPTTNGNVFRWQFV